jgi:hypothetical protein
MASAATPTAMVRRARRPIHPVGMLSIVMSCVLLGSFVAPASFDVEEGAACWRTREQ